MIRFYAIALLFVLTGTAIYSQSDYRPGYIVMNSGDTLKGEINLRSNDEMAVKCLFRPDKISPPQKYTPEELKEYRLDDGRYFISVKTPDHGPVFMEYLVNGRLSLYFLSGKKENVFYLKKGNDTLLALPKEAEYVMRDGTQYRKQPVLTRGILMNATREAPQLLPEIQTIDPKSQKELIRLAVNYNETVCSDEKCVVYKKKIETKVYLQPYYGMTNYFRADALSIDVGLKVHFWVPVEGEHLYLTTGLITSIFSEYHEAFMKIPLMIRYATHGDIVAEFSLGPEAMILAPDRLAHFETLTAFNGALNFKLSPKRDIYLNTGLGLETVSLFSWFDNSSLSDKFVDVSGSVGLYFCF